jgi:hypothetical protein
MSKVGEEGLADIICKRAAKVIERHGLDEDNFLAIKEVQFPHGRADVVIYGLHGGLYVVPLGIEVKRYIASGTDLFHYIEQIRETYEYAFTHIYLAVRDARKIEVARRYLEEVGYGLLRISEDGVEVDVEARPKKVYKSERDYCEVASEGMLRMAAIKALTNAGFGAEDVVVYSWGVGLKWPLNYCAFTRGDYAVFGVYALGLENVERLLKFLVSEKPLVNSLGATGYRVFLESYPVVKGVRGYVRPFDEPLSIDVVERAIDVARRLGLTTIKRWGVGLGIYKRLWELEFVPTYPTALKNVEGALAELIPFRGLFHT